MKTLIIGGVAGGASVAARLRRLDEQAEIVILERGCLISAVMLRIVRSDRLYLLTRNLKLYPLKSLRIFSSRADRITESAFAM